MKFFNKSTAEPISDEDWPIDFNSYSLSEGMIRRDNFFHNCWMLMKQKNPQLAIEMQNVELTIAGYAPDENESENDKDKEPEGVIL